MKQWNSISWEKWTILIPAFCLALSAGYLQGRLLSMHQQPITLRPDTRPLVPTVILTRIRNGNLEGETRGNVRLFVGDVPLIHGSGSFAVPAGPLLRQIIEVDVPSGAHFVASKRGKKYYAINASQAQSIAPGNRVYFQTAAQAESAGYVR